LSAIWRPSLGWHHPRPSQALDAETGQEVLALHGARQRYHDPASIHGCFLGRTATNWTNWTNRQRLGSGHARRRGAGKRPGARPPTSGRRPGMCRRPSTACSTFFDLALADLSQAADVRPIHEQTNALDVLLITKKRSLEWRG
jgi:hypothetical protein